MRIRTIGRSATWHRDLALEIMGQIVERHDRAAAQKHRADALFGLLRIARSRDDWAQMPGGDRRDDVDQVALAGAGRGGGDQDDRRRRQRAAQERRQEPGQGDREVDRRALLLEREFGEQLVFQELERREPLSLGRRRRNRRQRDPRHEIELGARVIAGRVEQRAVGSERRRRDDSSDAREPPLALPR